jgi:predicted nucleic acid-binding Zn ribbon protein
MDDVSSILDRALNKRGIRDEAFASWVVHRANAWLSENISIEGINATILRDGILHIQVPTSIAAQECHVRKEELLEKLRGEFPGDVVRAVRILRA